jgi:hypothetical protein
MFVNYYFVTINVTTFIALILLWVLGGFSFFFKLPFLIYFEKVIYVKTKSTSNLETIYSYSKITSKPT